MTITGNEMPSRLHHITDPPASLNYAGKISYLHEADSLAIVGSRRATREGCRLAFSFAYDLARAGVTVVSGMALGIDAMAHWGAHMAGGRTIGVLGCGLERDYPKRNRQLRQLMKRDQLLVTEYSPTAKPQAQNFPYRNRLISGLSMGVLVVEAEINSGTMTTVNHGLNQAKPIFVIPGSVEDPMKKGNNALIKMGAVPVTTPMDILSYLNLM